MTSVFLNQSVGSDKPIAVDSDSHDRLKRVQSFARWMDASFSVPGTPIRFGVDSLLGLIPGVGDTITAVTSVWLLNEARQAGVSKLGMTKMIGNIAIDLTAGAVPLVGDLFDVYWKSNIRNARILEQHLTNATGATAQNMHSSAKRMS